MTEFVYQGRTRSNQVVKGTISARDEVEARLLLREQQIRPTTLSQKGKMSLNMDLGDIFQGVPGLAGGVGLKDLVIFTRQFSVMIDSGLPQVQALDILSKQSENPSLRRVLEDVRTRVEQGSSLHSAMGRHPKIFNELFQNLVSAGELGGVLDVVLRRLADYMEKMAALISKVKSAMIYPIAVIVIAIVVVWGLLTFVVPKFAEFIKGQGGEMPKPTEILIAVSKILSENVMIFTAIMGLSAFGIYQAFKNPQTRRVLDRLMLDVPLIGKVIRKATIARFTRTFGILLQSGVPVLEGLEICAKVAGNYVIHTTLMKAREAISEGRPIATPLEQSQIFPPMVTHMIGVGEKTGALDQMLAKIADFYDAEVDESVTRMTTLIEPLLMVVLGTVVGGILIALYLPIFKLAGSIKGV